MSKFIIDNRTDLGDEAILSYVASVMAQGRISNEGKQYCYLTRFKHPVEGFVQVATDLNEKSDRFVIIKEPPRQDELDL